MQLEFSFRRVEKAPDRRHLYFQNQAPRIGSGWRHVEIISVGLKWARLRACSSGRAVRIGCKVFDGLKEWRP